MATANNAEPIENPSSDMDTIGEKPKNDISENSKEPQADDESKEEPRGLIALKQLFCGGVAGSAAKTVTAPLSRLTILFQVHSLVTTKENRPKFAMNFTGGFRKIVERGGFLSLWKGNGT